MKFGHYQLKDGENLKITVDDNPVYSSKVPSLLEVLSGFSQWKGVYDQVPGDIKGLMTENVIDHFHAHSVDTVAKLNHAGYTPEQISMETGLMPAKIDVVFEHIGVNKRVESPGTAMMAPQVAPVLPACHLWEVEHDYYGETTYNEMNFETWEDFMENMGKAEKCWNFLFRWDWYERDKDTDDIVYRGDDNERTGHVKFCYQAQRKGFSMSAVVKVARNEEPKVRAYLQEHWKYMEDMWAPISNGTSERVDEDDLRPRTDADEARKKYVDIVYGDKPWEKQEVVRKALAGFDPNSTRWVKHSFTVQTRRRYPAVFPPVGPWWYDDTAAVGRGEWRVVTYLPENVSVDQYWPTAVDVVSESPVDKLVFFTSDKKPDWWPF